MPEIDWIARLRPEDHVSCTREDCERRLDLARFRRRFRWNGRGHPRPVGAVRAGHRYRVQRRG